MLPTYKVQRRQTCAWLTLLSQTSSRTSFRLMVADMWPYCTLQEESQMATSLSYRDIKNKWCKYAYQNNILNNKSNGYINYIPRIVVDSKWATTWCCMSCCSKNTYVHTVSRQDGWWQSRLLSGGPPNTHKELWLLIPAPTFFFHSWLCTVENLLCGRLWPAKLILDWVSSVLVSLWSRHQLLLSQNSIGKY